MSTPIELQELTRLVIEIVAETRRIPAESITPESSFEELGVDSLDGLNIGFALADRFEVDFLESEMRHIRRIDEVVERIAALLAEKAAG